NTLAAPHMSVWFGQLIEASNDGGKTWEVPGGGITTGPGGMPQGQSNKFLYDTSPDKGAPLTTHQWYDGSQRNWEFKRVWHLEPSLDDPDTVYAGVEDAAIFKSTDGGKSWNELAGLRGHGTGPKWQPGAGGMCLHTILIDPTQPSGCSSPSPRLVPSGPTMGPRPGSRSQRASSLSSSLTRRRRSATASTESR